MSIMRSKWVTAMPSSVGMYLDEKVNDWKPLNEKGIAITKMILRMRMKVTVN